MTCSLALKTRGIAKECTDDGLASRIVEGEEFSPFEVIKRWKVRENDGPKKKINDSKLLESIWA